MLKLSGMRTYVAGHRGMVGSALCRRLRAAGAELVTVTREQLDLRDQAAVRAWMAQAKPQLVFLAAAKVGGIYANATYPADFIYENLMIEANVIEAAHRAEVEKLVFLGSSCIYPKFADQPIEETALLTGALEPTNQWYAIAKIAGIKLCQAYHQQHGRRFISAMPTNLYGPGDTYHPENSHVIPALIRRFIEAQAAGTPEVAIWGTGRALREFMHADDCADALVHIAQVYEDPEVINIASGQELSIGELAKMIAQIVGYTGAITYDTSRPDGTPRKRMSDAKLAALDWRPRHSLHAGLSQTIADVRASLGAGTPAAR